MRALKVRHSGINVTNLDRSIAAYESIGFKVAERMTERWQGKRGVHVLHIAKLEAEDGSRIELVQGHSKHHICVEVDSLGDFPAAKEAEDHRVTFINDPDGNRIELYQKKGEDKNG